MVQKIDFKKSLDGYQAKRGEFRLLEIPETNYLMVDGQGDPNSDPQFAAALEAMYPVAYKLKFASKLERDRDYVVPPLEALWFAQDMDVFTTVRDKSKWEWTVMLMVPPWLGVDDVDAAIDVVRAKSAPDRLADVRFETLNEGLCVQTLHFGSFDDEGPVLEQLHTEFIPGERLELAGQHHEVYFSDFRKTEPEKLRTLLRQPVRYVQ